MAADVVVGVVEVLFVIDRRGGAGFGPPGAADRFAPALGEFFTEPAFEPLQNRIGCNRWIGIEQDVDMIFVVGRGADAIGPAAAFTDFGDNRFGDGPLRRGEMDRVATHPVTLGFGAIGIAIDKGFATLIVLAINGWARVAVQTCAVGAEGEMPGSPRRIEVLGHDRHGI